QPHGVVDRGIGDDRGDIEGGDVGYRRGRGVEPACDRAHRDVVIGHHAAYLAVLHEHHVTDAVDLHRLGGGEHGLGRTHAADVRGHDIPHQYLVHGSSSSTGDRA